MKPLLPNSEVNEALVGDQLRDNCRFSSNMSLQTADSVIVYLQCELRVLGFILSRWVSDEPG